MLLEEIKEVYSRNSKLIRESLIHAGFMCGALIFAYNSYKEISSLLYGKYFLLHAQKVQIKDTFPWTVLIFTVLYILCSVGRNKEKDGLTIRQYGTVFVFHFAITNLIFFSKGTHVVIVLNSSLLYLAIFLLARSFIKSLTYVEWAKALVAIERFVPPILHKAMYNTSATRVAFAELSIAFIFIFASSLVICAFLLNLGLNRAAEDLANVAYFALLIGVGIKVINYLIYENRNEKKRN